MFLNIPKHLRKPFPNHFITKVDCEIEFPAIELNTILGNETTLQENLNTLDFITHEPVTFDSVYWEKKEGSTQIKHESKPHGFQYKTQPPNRTLTLNATQLLLGESNYTDFESFHHNLKNIMESVEKIIGKRSVIKVGLKKTNKINVSGIKTIGNACKILNPALLGGLRTGIGQIEDNLLSEERLVFQRDKVTCFLTVNIQKLKEEEYSTNLILDCVSTKGYETTEEVLNDVLIKMNDFHFNLFLWAITDDFKQLLGVNND